MEQEELRQRMQAYVAAGQPLLEWIAGAKALALLHGALRAGILDAARTPRTADAIAVTTGLAPGRAADVCAALEAHGVLEREGDTYRLTDAFGLLASSEAVQPLPAAVARGIAEAHLLEALPQLDAAYGALPPAERLVFHRGTASSRRPRSGAGCRSWRNRSCSVGTRRARVI